MLNRDRLIYLGAGFFSFAVILLVWRIFPILISSLPNYQQLMIFLLSLVLIGFYWFSYRSIINLAKKIDHLFTLLITVFLLGISFLPFGLILLFNFEVVPIIIAYALTAVVSLGVLLFIIRWHVTKRSSLVRD